MYFQVSMLQRMKILFCWYYDGSASMFLLQLETPLDYGLAKH